MVKINKWMTKKDIRRFMLIFGLGALTFSITELIIFLTKVEVLLLVITVFLLIPGVSLLFDGIHNNFLIKKVEIFKIIMGLCLNILIFILILLINSDILINRTIQIWILSIELLLIGSAKLYIGKINIQYVSWYRKWLLCTGVIIIILSLMIFFVISFLLELFSLVVFITLLFDGLSNILYAISNTVDSVNINNTK